jgi:2,4-dienoyl-CoA reductase-like NADH-dependent reductase (Old Yellow Enzyme family)
VIVTDDRHLAALSEWARRAQAGGARLWMQLNHTGRQSPRRLTKVPVAPSAVGVRGFGGAFARPRALADQEIEAIVARFATAAAVAQRAGFAGVQVHAAHGYLVSQFLSPLVNRRDDAWGGDPTRRSRFLLEIVRAIRAAVGPSFPIGVKLNSADFQRGGFTVEEAMDVARALETAGVDLLELSGGNYESPVMAGSDRVTHSVTRSFVDGSASPQTARPISYGGESARGLASGEAPAEPRASTREREAYFLDYARRIRAVTRLPIMLTGGMRTRATMERVLAEGAIDVIGMARPLSHAPDLPRALLDGTLDAAPAVRVGMRIRRLNDALQVFWFQEQLHRMARGLEPDLALSRYGALWRGLRATLFPVGGSHQAPAASAAPAGAAP